MSLATSSTRRFSASHVAASGALPSAAKAHVK